MDTTAQQSITERTFRSYAEQLHAEWTPEKWHALTIANTDCIALEKEGFPAVLPRWDPQDDFNSFFQLLLQVIQTRKHEQWNHINHEVHQWEASFEPRIAQVRLHFGNDVAVWLNQWRADRIKEAWEKRNTEYLRDLTWPELCEARWMGRKSQIAALHLPNATRTRFNELHGRLIETIRKYQRFIHPLDMPTADEVNQYCDNINKSVTEHLISSVENKWGPVAARDQATRARYNRMREKVSLGFAPYGPEDQSPFGEGQFKDVMRWRAPRLGFDHASRAGIEEGWTFGGVLGSGGFGYASIWVRCDDTGLVLDRVAVKESYVRHNWAWDAETNWEGPKADRVPLEFALQTLLSNAPDADSIVRCRAYGLYEWMRMYRLYMEYCPYSDLETSIRLHKHSVQGHNVFIPDRALWCVFEQLVGAACIMSQGYIPGNEAPEHGHRAVVHRDLKPENVFWGAPSTTWPTLPTAKVGDFGLAGYADTEYVMHGSCGTVGYKAPELCNYGSIDPVTPKADVWTIGRIMLSLINLSDNCEDSIWLPDDPDYDEAPVGFKPGMDTDRDPGLLPLILACLQPDPDDRRDAAQLYRAIENQIGGRESVMELKWGGTFNQNETLYIRQDQHAYTHLALNTV